MQVRFKEGSPTISPTISKGSVDNAPVDIKTMPVLSLQTWVVATSVVSSYTQDAELGDLVIDSVWDSLRRLSE